METTNIGQAPLTSSLPRGRRGTRSLAWLLSIAVFVLVGVGFSAIAAGDPLGVLSSAVALVGALTLTLTGAILITRLPTNRIGWLLSLGGLLFAFANSGSAIGSILVEHGVALGTWVFWLAELCWVPAIVCVAGFTPLLFPTGQLPSRRWRLVVLVALVSIALSTLQAAFSPNSALPGTSNPLAVTGSLADVLGLLGGLSSLAGVVCLPLVAASLVGRYREATGIERAQLRWFAAVAAIIGPAFAVGIAAGLVTTNLATTVADVAFLVMFVGLALLPIAIGIAVLRYHLYDIDLIVRRTAVYVPLTGILAGLYAASIALLQRVFIAATGGPSDGAIILSTLILATTFTPIRSWLQAIVDRRFGSAGDAGFLLEKFVTDNATAPWALDPARTMRAFLAVCVKAVGAAGGVAWVGTGDDERRAGRVGPDSEVGVLTLPVEAAGRRIGRLELGDRPGKRPYSDREVALLHRAAADVAGIVEPPSSV